MAYARTARRLYQSCGARGLLSVLRTYVASAPVPIAIPGSDQRVFLRPRTVDRVTFRQVFIEGLYRYEEYGDPRTIVDAGANCGFASLDFARFFPEARIVALEPNAENYEALRRNVSEVETIEPMRLALWSREGTLRLQEAEVASDLFRYGEGPSGASETVKSVTVSWLLETLGVRTIDILKLDVEGAEREILKGSESWIDRVRVIALELHDAIEPGCSQALDEALEARPHERVRRGDTTFVRLLQPS